MEKLHPAYKGDEPFVFISYSHADESIVYPEISWLQEQGYNIWYDEGISAASRWRDAIAGNIARCSLFVLYVSKNSTASQVCREELEYALDQQRQILSIHIEATELPDGMRLGISNRQALIRHELDADNYEAKLVEACRSHLGYDGVTVSTRSLPVLQPKRFRMQTTLLAVVGLLLGILGTTIWFRLNPAQIQDSLTELEFTIEVPEEERLSGGHDSISISRDGSVISYVSRAENGSNIIRQRPLTDRHVTEVTRDINRTWSLFNSPDGQWVGFYDAADITLGKVSTTTGETLLLGSEIALQGGFFGASWGADGSIVYADFAGGLKRITADGGNIETITFRESDSETLHLHPFILPDGKALLYTEYSTLTGDSRIMATRLDQENASTSRLILENGTLPKVSDDGILVFERGAAIWGASFDAKNLEATSEAVRIRDDLLKKPSGGVYIPVAYFDLSDNGTLIYRPREVRPLAIWPRTLHLVSRDGSERTLPLEPRDYRWLALSKDGCCIAMTYQNESAQIDIWRYNIERGALSRLTDNMNSARNLHFSPDGGELIFSSGVPPAVYKISARDGSSSIRLSDHDEEVALFASQWHTKSNSIFLEFWDGLNADIAILDPERKSLRRLTTSEYRESESRLSPDGNWLAFQSDQTGQSEIYVRPYPDVSSDLVIVSLAGGYQPRWHPDSKELFFLNDDLDLMSVKFDNGITGKPKRLFQLPGNTGIYLVMPGGEEFLMMKLLPRDQLPRDRIVVVTNFTEQIKRKLTASAID